MNTFTITPSTRAGILNTFTITSSTRTGILNTFQEKPSVFLRGYYLNEIKDNIHEYKPILNIYNEQNVVVNLEQYNLDLTKVSYKY